MRTVKLAALATAGVLALAGCAGNPQTAAYVGDVQIPESEVDGVSQVILATGSADTPSVARNLVVSIAIQNEIAKKAAGVGNITVTDEQRQQVLSQNAGLADLLKNPAAANFTSNYINTVIILSTDAGKSAAVKVIGTTNVRVNPRFGTWDPKQLALVEDSSGSISEIAPIKQE